jgi:hypothetical protein
MALEESNQLTPITEEGEEGYTGLPTNNKKGGPAHTVSESTTRLRSSSKRTVKGQEITMCDLPISPLFVIPNPFLRPTTHLISARCEYVMLGAACLVTIGIGIGSWLLWNRPPTDRSTWKWIGVVEITVYWPILLLFYLLSWLILIAMWSTVRTYRQQFETAYQAQIKYQREREAAISSAWKEELKERDERMMKEVEDKFTRVLTALLSKRKEDRPPKK